MLYRKIESYIESYLKSNDDRILCIDGARQVGKTYAIRKVLEKIYGNKFIEINMADDFLGDKLFSDATTIDKFYLQLSLIDGEKMNQENMIVFIDEIQIYPHLLTLLKPLRTDNKFKYICSGSLLGVTLSKTTLIPMGSIRQKTLYPLDFEEFLIANNVGDLVIKHMRDSYNKRVSLDEPLHNKILDFFKWYLIVGGLPDAVKEYVVNKNIYNIKKIQEETMNFYKDDAGKYDVENKLKIESIYDMQASFIDNKVKRVTFNKIENSNNARFLKYQNEFEYLVSSGISLSVCSVSEPKFPLISSSKRSLFKLYYNDVGILTNLLYKTNIKAIMEDKTKENLGAVYETLVAQELKAHGYNLYYFDRRAVGEIDFLIDDYDNLSILPIEVKSGSDTYTHRALSKVVSNKNYNIKFGYVFSNNRKVSIINKKIYLPIYYVMFV